MWKSSRIMSEGPEGRGGRIARSLTLPTPSLPSLRPPCRGERGSKQEKLFAVLPPLPGRMGGGPGEEGRGGEASDTLPPAKEVPMASDDRVKFEASLTPADEDGPARLYVW